MGLVQAPVFHFYLVVPIAVFVVDKLITISRSKVKISVIKAEPLPSGSHDVVIQMYFEIICVIFFSETAVLHSINHIKFGGDRSVGSPFF